MMCPDWRLRFERGIDDDQYGAMVGADDEAGFAVITFCDKSDHEVSPEEINALAFDEVMHLVLRKAQQSMQAAGLSDEATAGVLHGIINRVYKAVSK